MNLNDPKPNLGSIEVRRLIKPYYDEVIAENPSLRGLAGWEEAWRRYKLANQRSIADSVLNDMRNRTTRKKRQNDSMGELEREFDDVREASRPDISSLRKARRGEDDEEEKVMEIEMSKPAEEDAVEEEVVRRPPRRVIKRKALNDGVEDAINTQINNVQANDPNRDSILAFLEETKALRLSLGNSTADAHTLAVLKQWILGKTPHCNVELFKLYKFFAVIYQGIIRTPENERFRNNRKYFSNWKKEVIREVRASTIFSGYVRENVLGAADFILYRLTLSQVLFIIELLQEHWPGDETYEIIVEVRTTMEIGANQAAEEMLDPNRKTDAEIKRIWECFFEIAFLMKTLWSSNIRLTNLLLDKPNYKEVIMSENGTSLNHIQAYPFLITDIPNNNIENQQDRSYILNLLRNYFEEVAGKDLNLFRLKVRVKKLVKPSNGSELMEDLEEHYFMDQLNIFTALSILNKEDHTRLFAAMNGEINDQQTIQTAKTLLRGLMNSFAQNQDLLNEWFENELWNTILNKNEGEYIPTFVKDAEDQIDKRFFLIDGIQIIIKTNEDELNVPRRRFLPVHLKSAFGLIFKKIGKLSETPNNLICLYESLWTCLNYDSIIGQKTKKIKRGGQKVRLSYWKRDERLLLMEDDFKDESHELQNICIRGDYTAFEAYLARYNKYKHIQLNIWEESHVGWKMLPGKTDLIMCYNGHASYCDIDKVRELITKKDAPQENKTFMMRQGYAKEKGKENVTNYFYDIETYTQKDGRMLPYLCCVTNDRNDDKKIFWGFDCIDQFITWFKSIIPTVEDVNSLRHNKRDVPQVCLIGYNSSKFDLVYIAKHLVDLPGFQLKGNFTNIKSLQGAGWFFLDLYKICPFGKLSDQQEFWGTSKSKGSINHDSITKEVLEAEEENGGELKAKIIDYCITDCEVLGECFVKYCDWVYSVLGVSPYQCSTPGLAMAYFKKEYYPKDFKDEAKKNWNNTTRITGVAKEFYNDFKAAYKGGMTLVLRKILEEDEIFCEIDVNSAYPDIMANHSIPIKMKFFEAFKTKRDLLSFKHQLIDQELYAVQGLKWKDETKYPTIPKRTVRGLLYPLEFENVEWIWGVELKFAVETGLIEKGVVHGKYSFYTSDMFSPFIKDVYAKRLKAKADKDQKSVALWKLVMNSVYGKFGQKIFPKKIYCGLDKLQYYCNVHVDTTYIIDIDQVTDGLFCLTLNDYDYSNQIGGCVHIAGYITAANRARMCKIIQRCTNNFTLDNLLYMDTDAIFVTKKKDSTEDFPPKDLLDKDKLGLCKVEFWGKEAYFIAAKVYYCVTESGEVIKKCKGLKDEKITKEHYLELLNNKKCLISSGLKFVRHRAGYVSKFDNTKYLTIEDKRVFTFDGKYSKPPRI